MLAFAAPVGTAAEWTIEPFATLDFGYSSNVELEPVGEEESDYGFAPGVGALIGEAGSRTNLAASIQVQGYKFIRNPDLDNVQGSALGLGFAELVDDWLYLDAHAVAQQLFIDPLGGTSLSGFNNTDNRTLVQSYRASPFVRRRLGGWGTIETRYAFNYVDLGSSGVPDATTNQVTGLFTSGRRFSRLDWSLTADYERSRRSNGDTPNRILAAVDTFYPLFRRTGLLVGAGYEKIADPDLSDDISGAIGEVGFEWVPSRALLARGTVGYRFDRVIFSFLANWEISPKTLFRASFEESLQTSQRLYRTDLGYLGTNPAGELVDERTDRAFVVGDPAFGIIAGTFFRKRVSTQIRRTTERNIIEIVGYGESRKLESGGSEERAAGVELQWRRRLNRRLYFDLLARYDHINREEVDTGKDSLLVGRSKLAYRLNAYLDLGVTYYFSLRNASESSQDLQEHAVVLSLQLHRRRQEKSPANPRTRPP